MDRLDTRAPLSTSAESRLLRGLFDKLPAMIAYWDDQQRNVIANEAYVEWFGRHPDEMVGMHISEVLGPEVYAKNRSFIEAALRGEEQLFERRLVDQSGRVRYTQASYVPDVEDGEVRGFFALVTDVTPRVEAREAMDEAQQLARLGSWTLIPSTGHITWSRELFHIVGMDPTQDPPTLDTLSSFIHPDDRERVLANIARASSTVRSYESEYRIVRTDGQVRELASRGQSVADENGEVVRVSGTLQDVTESNSIARDLARTNAQLLQANQLNADVLAMLGHDIRTPLAAIKGYLELLDTDYERSPDASRHLIARTRAVTDNLVAMVARILSLAAVDSGTIDPHPETIDLATALLEIAATTAAWPQVTMVVGPATPPVAFDPVHLEQIVENLLTNAARYGEPPFEIATRVLPEGVEIAISDGGPGVPPDVVPRLFTRFARTGEPQRRSGGAGFGLYMSARLAAANLGALTYEPSSAHSAHRFCLRVPRAPEPTSV